MGVSQKVPSFRVRPLRW